MLRETIERYARDAHQRRGGEVQPVSTVISELNSSMPSEAVDAAPKTHDAVERAA